MVAARITRQAVEVVSSEPTQARVGRLDAEVATLRTAANTVDRVRVSRMAVEVVSTPPTQAFIGRLDAEVATKSAEATTAVAARITRQAVEVVTQEVIRARMSRLDAEVATKATEATSVVPVRVSRMSAELVAREGSATTVAPLALASGIEVFLHNWVTAFVLRTRYVTDVSTSASTGAEARRGLVLKPERTMKLIWELDEIDRMDRLLVILRKLTDERLAIPLYVDQKELNAEYLSSDTTVFFDTTRGRWFIGARVVIVQVDADGSYESHTFHLIQSKQTDRVTFTTSLGVNVKSTSIILPMMDCEVTLAVEMGKQTTCHGRVEMELSEVFGASQLPAVKADFPSGVNRFGDYPIFDINADWIDGITVGRDRQGKEFRRGRTNVVSKSATRSRQTHRLSLTGNRDDMWRVVEFFDTRRGRLRAFFLIDYEFVWTPTDVDVSGNFVGVEDLGDFTDFQAELLGGFIGIVMKDGTMYVRNAVTIQQVFTVNRITVSPALPSGINVADIDRIARARFTRFSSDEMVETWRHTCYAGIELEFLEALEEKIVEI